MNNLFPDLETVEQTFLLLFDRESDTILGYNSPFISLYCKNGPNTEWLHRKATDLFDRSPSLWQNDQISKLPLPGQLLSGQNLKGFKHTSSIDAPYTLDYPIFTEKEDFDLRITVKSRSLEDFFITLHSEQMEEYFFGFEGTSRRSVIKRRGFLAACGPVWDLGSEKQIDFTVIKRGNVVAFDINGRRYTAFEDPHFPHSPKGMTLCLNPRAGLTTLVEMELSVKSVSSHQPVIQPICQSVHEAKNYYSFSPFYTKGLSLNRYQHVSGYLFHDITVMEKRSQLLSRSLRKKEEEAEELKQQIKAREQSLIIGQSPLLEKIKSQAERAAVSQSTILINGATGTGKEVLARWIHQRSLRSKGVFIKADLGALPESLMLSELFGHKKGAFTGAERDRQGLVESARGGTLFLDEIANIPLSAQGYLLRFLNDGTFHPLGSDKPVTSDVRLIIATNADLAALIKKGAFREDLYFRISAITLNLPSLNERKEDIPLLALHTLEQIGTHFSFSKEAMNRLCNYSWPGNIRELFSVVQNAAALADGDKIESDHLSFPANVSGKVRKPRTPFKVRQSDPEIIRNALFQHNGVVVKAAKALNIDRRTLYLYMQSKGWKADAFRTGLPE
ncbi:MAG: sigma-54-dependent Fis family transcriptional regulator [Fibrobacteres bacterium]|nr:sigma-54-dependent Fis family transcriptional regulator [Fibrobacterota bacterium]